MYAYKRALSVRLPAIPTSAVSVRERDIDGGYRAAAVDSFGRLREKGYIGLQPNEAYDDRSCRRAEVGGNGRGPTDGARRAEQTAGAEEAVIPRADGLVADGPTRAAAFFALAFVLTAVGGVLIGDLRTGVRWGIGLGAAFGVFAYLFVRPARDRNAGEH